MFLRTITICFFLVVIYAIDSSVGFCTDKSFGTNCQINQFKCRCKLDERCNDNTGECSSGCHPRWMGPACQYGNLAYGKSVGGSFLSKERLTDGNKASCAAGNPITNTHLSSINLGSAYNVVRLVIYNRDYASHPLNNFIVYVGSEEVQYSANSVCYENTETIYRERLEVKCTSALTGQYIQIVITTGVESHICEIELYGGLNVAYKKATAQYQTYWTFPPELAVDGIIDNFSHTKKLWEPWWRVTLGSAVLVERIRVDNRKDCCNLRLEGAHVILFHDATNVFEHSLEITSQTSLVIDISLVPAKTGNKVELTIPNKNAAINIAEVEVYFNCRDGWFGIDCQNRCNCNDTTEGCDKIYGECSSGCAAGYTGTNCLSLCPVGTFGPSCMYTCNCEIATENCRHTDGYCQSGCKKGYTGYGCLNDCPDGTFGFNCQNKCNCLSNTEVCDKSTGGCIDGCREGFTGDDCLMECPNGLFGVSCKYSCNCENKTEVCHNTDGYCKDGCRKGYTGTGCLEECSDGFYGVSCLNACSNCKNKDCDRVIGRCDNGCVPGYTGNRCDGQCLTGTYGVNCSETCVNCDKTLCNHVTGLCNSGCKAGYTGTMCSKLIAKDTDNGVIIGAAVGAVVVIVTIVVVVIFILFLRRRTKRHKQEDRHSKEVVYENAQDVGDRPSCKLSANQQSKLTNSEQPVPAVDATIYDQPDNESDTELETSTAKATISTSQGGLDYYNAEIQQRSKTSVTVDELWNYVSKMIHDAFKHEFEELPSGMTKRYDAAKANMSKNRYRGIYAYDHSRVKLSPTNPDGCDYMNANFVEGYGGSRMFIASQGTTEQNISDFWMMVWQQKCTTIVMLTNLIEEGRVKCLVYWPEEGKTQYFGAVKVTLLKEEVFCNFTIRSLKAQKDDETRNIYQYHFTAWPDKGVPAYPSSLVHFHKKILSTSKAKAHPIVVHCSAGIGRTGTYIALDYLVEEARETGIVDIFGSVQKLREQRTNMIQTLDQYIFLHTALVEALHCKGHSMSSEEFRKLYADISGKRGSKILEDDFKKLETVYSGYDIKFTDGKMQENLLKNRDQNIIPADSERPILSTHIPGCSNYINAVFLPGLRKRRQFIVTQTPLENTVIDFWRMVYEQDTKVIVDMSSDPEGYQVYPDTGDLMIGPITVTSECQKHDKETDSLVQTLTVKYHDVHTVMLFKPQFWDLSQVTPTSIPLMVNLIYETNRTGQYGHNGGIVVACPNGATRCGLFCVAFVSLDRLRVEQEVGTGQIIKQYRSIRPQIIPNKEQLKYCYDILMSQLNENETYSNFA